MAAFKTRRCVLYETQTSPRGRGVLLAQKPYMLAFIVVTQRAADAMLTVLFISDFPKSHLNPTRAGGGGRG